MNSFSIEYSSCNSPTSITVLVGKIPSPPKCQLEEEKVPAVKQLKFFKTQRKLEMLEPQKVYSGTWNVFVAFFTCICVHLHCFYSYWSVKKQGETNRKLFPSLHLVFPGAAGTEEKHCVFLETTIKIASSAWWMLLVLGIHLRYMILF